MSVQKPINATYPWWAGGSRNEKVINMSYPWWAGGSRNEKTIDPPNHLIRDACRLVATQRNKDLDTHFDLISFVSLAETPRSVIIALNETDVSDANTDFN